MDSEPVIHNLEDPAMMVGYRCGGCGESFMFADYKQTAMALKEVSEHVRNEHNTKSEIEPVTDKDER